MVSKELLNNLYFDKDADLSLIQAKIVAIIGYGNQGRAQALNLRDSGVKVIVGAREGGSSEQQAKEDGFNVLSIQEAVKNTDIIAILLPDQVMSEVYDISISPNLSAGKILQFSHGYNIHYENTWSHLVNAKHIKKPTKIKPSFSTHLLTNKKN